MSSFAADTAGLIQKRWADNFSIRSGLVFDEVAVVFVFGFSGITTHLTEWRGSDRSGFGGIGIVVRSGGRGRGRHFDLLFLIE